MALLALPYFSDQTNNGNEITLILVFLDCVFACATLIYTISKGNKWYVLTLDDWLHLRASNKAPRFMVKSRERDPANFSCALE